MHWRKSYKMRQPTACVQCRVAKRRCSRLGPDDGCAQCKRQHIPCSLGRVSPATPNNSDVAGQPTQTQWNSSDNPWTVLGDEVVADLVNAYIHTIHDRPHSLFHVPTLWLEIEEKVIPSHLLFSICAIGSRLSTDPDVRAKIQALATWSRTAFFKAMEDFSLQTVQTCILLANICAADLQPEGEALYFGEWVRFAD